MRPWVTRSALVMACGAVAACADSAPATSPTTAVVPVTTVTTVAADTTPPVDGVPEIAALDAAADTADDARVAESVTDATAHGSAPWRCTAAPAVDTNVEVWHAFGPDTVAFAVLDAQVERFETTHPGAHVELTRVDGTGEALVRLAELPPAERPHVFLGAAATVRNQTDSGLFVPPAECAGGTTPAVLADVLPVVRHAYQVDGVLQAAPYGVSAPVMMYDRTRWREAGLDPDDPPTTWDDLFATVEALAASGVMRYGAALYDGSGAWLVSHVAAQEGRLLVEPANGHAGSQVDAVHLASPTTIDLLARFGALDATQQILWAGLNESGLADLLALVRIGGEGPSAGLTFHTAASLGDVYTLLAEVPDLADVDVGVAALPGPQISPPGGNAWWLVDRGDTAQVGAAWEFVEWLSQPAQNAELAAATGYAPITPAAAAEPVVTAAWEVQPNLRVAYDLIAATPATDAAAGLQVGPAAEVLRQIELAAAWPIDAHADPAAKLAEHGDLALAHLAEYAADHAGR